MGRIETDVKSTKNKKMVSSSSVVVKRPNDGIGGLDNELEFAPPIFKKPNYSQYGLIIGSDRQLELAVQKELLDSAMETFTQSARIMSDHVVSSIVPLCSISAMGDRIDRLNRENAETLDKLINGRL